jgi:hypothetical protein
MEVRQMAQVLLSESTLKVVFQNGLKENGEPNLVSKSLRNVKESATPEEIIQVVDALSSLVAYTLHSVVKNDSFDVTR